MEILRKKISASSVEDYYKRHLSLINQLFSIKFTEKEVEVLSSFMSLDKSIADDYVFNTLARKKVMEKLSLKPGGLSNYLSSMISKGFLIKNPITGKITIQGYLIPEENSQKYDFKLVRKHAEV